MRKKPSFVIMLVVSFLSSGIFNLAYADCPTPDKLNSAADCQSLCTPACSNVCESACSKYAKNDTCTCQRKCPKAPLKSQTRYISTTEFKICAVPGNCTDWCNGFLTADNKEIPDPKCTISGNECVQF